MEKITSFCFLLITAMTYGIAHCGLESGDTDVAMINDK